MKKLIYSMITMMILTGSGLISEAQTKHTTITNKKVVHKISTPKFIEHNYGSPSSVADIKDVTAADNEYSSVKNLVENNKVMLVYDDNTFHGKEPLRRGDFVLTFNSALNALNMLKANASVDTNVIYTYDKNRKGAYLTSVSQVKDLKDNSIYYPASKSLIETWGISEPFLTNKTLSPSSVMTEKEVYKILNSTLGYTSSALNPYATEITRGKFAIALNNAMMQKGEQIAELHTQVMVKREADRRAQQAIMDQQDKIRKDSVFRVMETQKLAAANLELASKSKSKRKSH